MTLTETMRPEGTPDGGAKVLLVLTSGDAPVGVFSSFAALLDGARRYLDQLIEASTEKAGRYALSPESILRSREAFFHKQTDWLVTQRDFVVQEQFWEPHAAWDARQEEYIPTRFFQKTTQHRYADSSEETGNRSGRFKLFFSARAFKVDQVGQVPLDILAPPVVETQAS